MTSVLYRRRGRIAHVTLNRPGARNALTAEMGERLAEAWQRIEEDPEVAVAIVSGPGERAFCAGVDLAELRREPPELRDLTGFGGTTVKLAKPLVAAVGGVAIGAGAKLAMCADVIVAARGARFVYPEAQVGVIGDADFVHRPMRRLPRHEALALLLTGRPLEAERAAELGLVDELVEPEELAATAERRAESLARTRTV